MRTRWPVPCLAAALAFCLATAASAQPLFLPNGICWNSTAAEVAAALPDIQRPDPPLEAGRMTVPIVASGVTLGPLTLSAQFQFEDGALRQVLLDNRRAAADPAALETALAQLWSTLGPPDRRCPDRGLREAELIWDLPDAVLHLVWFDYQDQGLPGPVAQDDFFGPRQSELPLSEQVRQRPDRFLLRWRDTDRSADRRAEDTVSGLQSPMPLPRAELNRRDGREIYPKTSPVRRPASSAPPGLTRLLLRLHDPAADWLASTDCQTLLRPADPG
ncbi:hypothetical protein [Oceanomicrobium pacificus]|uniref:Uncharacterized protein n=1 Tax=Oceanomicrobium pacificus TaxID=2692916 RepID=A0A6B0TLN1_9RHOB|nr:hypothetical protein [Oceanomicrobium pacificus]MXU65450.1 hypothetical protein [Oceanomicrobium pacificus]